MSEVSRRAVLGAYVEPLAAVVMLRQFGGPLEQYAAAMAGSSEERDRAMAREIRVSLSRMREVARQLGERRRSVPPTSVGGSEEVEQTPRDAGLSHPPETLVGRWSTTGEVAAELGVTRRQVGHLIDKGRGPLPATMRGRTWYVAQADLDEFLDSRRPA